LRDGCTEFGEEFIVWVFFVQGIGSGFNDFFDDGIFSNNKVGTNLGQISSDELDLFGSDVGKGDEDDLFVVGDHFVETKDLLVFFLSG